LGEIIANKVERPSGQFSGGAGQVNCIRRLEIIAGAYLSRPIYHRHHMEDYTLLNW
jgi:hypothetical protein